jgi:hypothetical protein
VLAFTSTHCASSKSLNHCLLTALRVLFALSAAGKQVGEMYLHVERLAAERARLRERLALWRECGDLAAAACGRQERVRVLLDSGVVFWSTLPEK